MAQKSHGMSWGDVNPSSGNDNKSYMDVIDLHKFDPEWSAIRLVGSVFPIRQHWIPVQTKGGKKNFSRVCLKTLDPSAHCPYCEAGFKTSSIFLHNAISVAFRKINLKIRRNSVFQRVRNLERKETLSGRLYVLCSFPLLLLLKLSPLQKLIK